MRKMYRTGWWRTDLKKIFIIISFVLFAIIASVNVNAEDEDMTLNAKSAVLIDEISGRVLYGKNENEKMPMASTTKIMTCIIALENGKPDDKVKVSNYASSMPDVQLNIRTGEEYRLGDLLYSLMLESHNDTAVAIAEHIGGTVEGFASMMNRKAKELGANDTNFVTPNGLDDDKHYTTAANLACIARYAMKNPRFVEIINTKSYSFSEINNKRNFSVNNKDAFLSMMDGAVGIKTGFTGKAGYCFVGALHKDNKKFISVVLASGWPPSKGLKWKDTQKLMKYGLDKHEYRVIYNSDEFEENIVVEKGVKKKCKVFTEGYINTLVTTTDSINVTYDFPKRVYAPVHRNQKIGNAIITINNKEINRYPIRVDSNIQKEDYVYKLRKILTLFLLAFF